MEKPQKFTATAVLSSLPSIWVALDNSGMENRRGVSHAQLPEKTFQNYNATVITGHRAELNENKAGLVGDRGQPSDKRNAILKGWHNVRAHSGRAMVGIIMMAGNCWVSGDGCHQIRCKRDTAWSCHARIN